MALYLDTEFNGFGGELISLALVSDMGDEFYEVLPLPSDIQPWVREHVVPVLGKEPIDREVFRASLWSFLSRAVYRSDGVYRSDEEVIADFPEDIAHLCRALCKDGQWYPAVARFHIRTPFDGALEPAIPHNALEDARALMRWHTGRI